MTGSSGSIGMSNSADSCSLAQPGWRVKKRSSNALLNEENETAPAEPRRCTKNISHGKKEDRGHTARQDDEIDESFGFGCVGCGRWRQDPHDPFGMKMVLRTMIQEKFSSRVDFSEEAEHRRRYPVAINFVEHRLWLAGLCTHSSSERIVATYVSCCASRHAITALVCELGEVCCWNVKQKASEEARNGSFITVNGDRFLPLGMHRLGGLQVQCFCTERLLHARESKQFVF